MWVTHETGPLRAVLGQPRDWSASHPVVFPLATYVADALAANARRMRSILIGDMRGRPRRRPAKRARCRPASTRSRIIARSNSLNTDSIPNSIRPKGVEVSRACWCR